MTVRTLHGEKAFAIHAALDVLEVDVTVFSLEGRITFRVAVHATGMHEDRVSRKKCGTRPGVVVLNR